MQRVEWKEAVDHFTAAVKWDSTFAHAWAGLAEALLAGGGGYDSFVPAVETAWRLRGSLPDRQRLVVEGRYYGFHKGDAEEGIARFREVLAEYPNDVDALLGIGWLLYETNPYYGRRAAEGLGTGTATIAPLKPRVPDNDPP